LNDGVMMLIRGHASPFGDVGGNDALVSVHGQPVRPGGGAGSSCSVGQRIGGFASLSDPAGNG